MLDFLIFFFFFIVPLNLFYLSLCSFALRPGVLYNGDQPEGDQRSEGPDADSALLLYLDSFPDQTILRRLVLQTSEWRPF